MTPPEGDGDTDSASAGVQPAPPRRSRGRRALRTGFQLVLALGLLAVLVVALAFAFLHTGPGRGAARVFLQVWGSGLTGGTLRVGALDYALWRGEAVLTGTRLELTGVTVDAQRVEVQWPPGSRPSVRLVQPIVVYRDTGQPKARAPAVGLAAQPWRALDTLAAAEVVEGRIELHDVDDVPWLVVGRLDARMAADGAKRLTVRAADVVVGKESGPHLEPVSVEGTLALEDGRLVLEQVTLAARGASVDLRGEVGRVSPVDAKASARASLDAALVRTLSPGAEIAGRVEADAVLQVSRDVVSATIGATSPALTVLGVGPWATSARGRLEGQRLVLESLEARAFGGRLLAEGPLALRSDDTTDLRVTVEGFEVAAFVAAVAETELPVAARADAWVRWTTTGWNVEAAKGMGDVALQPAPRAARPGARPGIPVEARSHVHIAGRTVELQEVSVEARGALLEADARISRGSLSGTWNATVPLASIDPLLADLGAEPAVPQGSAGRLVVEGTLSGPPPRRRPRPGCGARRSPSTTVPSRSRPTRATPTGGSRSRPSPSARAPGGRRSPALARCAPASPAGSSRARPSRWTSPRSWPAWGSKRACPPRETCASRGRS